MRQGDSYEITPDPKILSVELSPICCKRAAPDRPPLCVPMIEVHFHATNAGEATRKFRAHGIVKLFYSRTNMTSALTRYS
jgi:hypothetical protein